MKNKYIVLLLNILLVFLVGLIIGISFNDNIFGDGVSTVSFILLLVTLILSIVLYSISNKLMTGSKICILFFILIEVVINIIFMCNPSLGVKSMALTQTISISTLILSLIIIAALFKDDKLMDN